ncbi:MAG: flagellar hook-associated protein FlgL [Clostridia bacterium]|nr:flagellar hook-associated protein FlgL [Clostridia bacterium]
MRITNNIMVSNALSGLQKSLTALNNYSRQVETGKKIEKASDNPVIASKSIRYRTRLYEIDQYKSNVAEANSWLSSTETTLSSSYSILKRIRELAEDCASETITDSDRNQSLIEIKELRSQLAQEANTNIAGRYIFSGFKTDTKVMFNSEEQVTYNLKETLSYKDTDEINATEDGTIKGYSVKLLYGTIADDSVTLTLKTSTGDIINYPSTVGSDKYEIKYVNATDNEPYNVPEVHDDGTGVMVHTIHIIKDTGEIVFNEADKNALSNDIEVEYTKNRFSDGDLNPVHYLVCSEKVDVANPNIGTIKNNRLVLEPTEGIKEDTVTGLYVGSTQIIDEDGNIKTPYEVKYVKSTDNSPLGANEVRICTDSGEIRFGSGVGAEGKIMKVSSYYRAETNPSLIKSTKEILYKEDLVGALNSSREITLTNKGKIDPNSISGLKIKKADDTFVDIAQNKITYTTSDSPIVPGADEVVIEMDTGKLIAGSDFLNGEVYCEGLFVSNEEKVNEEIKYEVNSNSSIVVNALAQDVFTTSLFKDLDLLISRIQNFPRDEVTTFLSKSLEEIDNHMEEVLKQNSSVGSKMNRLELISTRLADDKINFRDLQSENEDVDEAEAATNLAIQEMVYNAALQTTSKVLQTSLLDFLQ